MASDHADFFRVSAGGGHAGPSSTMAYVHWIEKPLAAYARAARPEAWCVEEAQSWGNYRFEDVGEGLLGERSPLPPPRGPQDVASAASLRSRAQIVWLVAQELALESVAGATMMPLVAVQACVKETGEAMSQAGLAPADAASNLRRACQAVSARFLWARAAMQPKHRPILDSLDAAVMAGQWSKLQSLWHAWSVCRDGNDFSLAPARSAARFLGFLLEAGVQRRSLAILAADDKLPDVLRAVAADIRVMPSRPRKGRAIHRLVLSPPGVPAHEASGATVSMVGVHWLLLILGGVLVARGEG